VQGNRAYGGVTTKMPIKLITAGVIPIIFAQVFLSVPLFIGQLLSSSANERWAQLSQNLVLWFQPPSAETMALGGWHMWIYPLAIFVLVFIFTFFYTSVTFNTNEIADNLQKQGGFIEGVRSGAQTETYLSKMVNRLTLFGAISLGALAASPYVIQIIGAKFNLNIGVKLDGTGMLILVAVALETLRQIESRALMVTYDQYDQPDFFYETSTEEGLQAKKRSLNFLRRKNKK
jgi:preprotein translocase subunit SecY